MTKSPRISDNPPHKSLRLVKIFLFFNFPNPPPPNSMLRNNFGWKFLKTDHAATTFSTNSTLKRGRGVSLNIFVEDCSPDGLIFQDQKWNNIIEVKCLNILRLNSVESIVNGDCLKAEIKRKFIITRFNCSCWWQKLTFVTLCSFFRERAFKHRKGFSWCRVAKPYNWKHPIVLGESFYSRIFFYK